jgi:hypothetical protein
MRRLLLVSRGIALLLGAGLVVGSSVADRVRYPRDEDGFQDYVVTYMLHPGTQEDKDWSIDHPDEILAEGDRSCAWLSRRDSSPDIDPSGATSVYSLVNAYLKDADIPLTRYGHANVVYGAWEFLCQAERNDKSAPRSEDED